MDEGRSAFKILTGKPTGNRPLSRPRRRWDNIRMHFKEIGISTRYWVELGILEKKERKKERNINKCGN